MLTDLLDQHPLPALVMKYRKLRKLLESLQGSLGAALSRARSDAASGQGLEMTSTLSVNAEHCEDHQGHGQRRDALGPLAAAAVRGFDATPTKRPKQDASPPRSPLAAAALRQGIAGAVVPCSAHGGGGGGGSGSPMRAAGRCGGSGVQGGGDGGSTAVAPGQQDGRGGGGGGGGRSSLLRLRGTYLQTAASSGRLAMDDPNLQTVPKPVVSGAQQLVVCRAQRPVEG